LLFSVAFTTGWSLINTTGTIPPPTCGCAFMLHNDDAYIFAGYTSTGHNNNLYHLDLLSFRWTLLSCNNKPVKRAYLQALYVDGTIYTFGG
jgi:hypothetical protein